MPTVKPMGGMDDQDDEGESLGGVGTVNSFQKQLVQLKKDMVDNRKVISNVLGEVTTFRQSMLEMHEEQKEDLNKWSGLVLQNTQVNIMMETGHMVHDLNHCEKRYTFPC